MAILCSNCGAQIPRPDVSRVPLVCDRCAAHDASGKPPEVKPSVPPPSASTRPSMRPVGGPPGARIPAGGVRPSVAPRPSTAPVPSRASAAPTTPVTAPQIPAAPRPANIGAPRPGTTPPSAASRGPVPRAAPKPEAAPARAGKKPPAEEFSTLDTGDFEIVNHAPKPKAPVLQLSDSDDDDPGAELLSTGDFEPVDQKPKPPRP